MHSERSWIGMELLIGRLAGTLAGSVTFGLILDLCTKVERQTRLYKKNCIVNFYKLRAHKSGKFLYSDILIAVCAASLVAVSIADTVAGAFMYQQLESTEREKDKENLHALQHVDLVTFSIKAKYHVERILDSKEQYWIDSKSDKIVTCGVALSIFSHVGPFQMTRPTDLTKPGLFAVASWPATQSRATRKKRMKMQKLGSLFGCHHCGIGARYHPFVMRTVEQRKFVADHIPPNSVANEMKRKGVDVVQRIYPQCRDCSQKQSLACNNLLDLSKGVLEHKLGSRPQYYVAGAMLAGSRTLVIPIAKLLVLITIKAFSDEDPAGKSE